MINHFKYLLLILFSSFSFATTLTINEIMNNPSAVSDSDGEWFEIYNNGDASHDLNGWTIKDNNASHIINNSILIHPGDYKIFSNNSDQNSNGGVVVDYEYGNLTLANSGDELVLIDPNGTVFDSVAYDGGPEFPDLNGASMGVIDSETDNNIGSNWQASTTAYGDGDLGTPGLPNFSSDIDVELATIDFDTVLVGESSDKVLTISNIGNIILVIDSVYTSSEAFTLPFTETSVETSLELNITFTPSAYGIVEDILVIKTNDPDEGHVEIPLIGLGYIPSPNIVLESTSIDFGTVMDGLTETIELLVANDGDAALSLSSVYIEGSTNFTIPTFSTSVAENDTGLIDIQFSPDDETSFSGTLYIVSNDPDTDTLMVTLSGIGGEQDPIMMLSDERLYFGTVQEGATVGRELTIYNDGILDLEIEEFILSGGDTSIFSTNFSDASVESGDSVALLISAVGQTDYQTYHEILTLITNDGDYDIMLIVGSNIPPIAGVNVSQDGGIVQIIWNDVNLNSQNNEIIYDDGTFENEQAMGEGSTAIVGTYFDVHYGVNNLIVNKVSIHGAENSVGETTIYGYDAYFDPIEGIIIEESPIYSKTFTTSGQWEEEIIDWSFAGSFLIGYQINESVGVAIDGSGLPSKNSYVFINGQWEPWHEISAANDGVEDGEFGIRVNIDIVEQQNALYNVYRNVNGGDYDITINGQNLLQAEYTDSLVQAGIEYCYYIIAIYDDNESQMIEPECVIAEPSTIYEIVYDDGTNEDVMPVGNGNFIASKFTPNGYPSSLYSSSIYVENAVTGIASIYVWDDNGPDGNPGDVIINGLSTNLIQGWNEINFVNEGFDIDIEEGSVYVGYQQLNVNFNIGVDLNNSSYASNSMLDFGIGIGWEQLSTYSPGGVWMIRAKVDSVNAVLEISEKSMHIPDQFAVHQNYPNPFNPITSLRYDLPEDGLVNIIIYDMMGRMVKTLVNSSQTAGYKSIIWNATNNRNEPVSAGLYLYTIQAGEFRQTRKMVLLK